MMVMGPGFPLGQKRCLDMQIDEKINREEQTASLESTDEVCEKGPK